ncbi:MAG: prolipoprotein diacylglyceryl transferase, partial [Chloroflexi bacterium]
MPEGFFIGPFQVRFYGIILMLGAVAGAWLAGREAK